MGKDAVSVKGKVNKQTGVLIFIPDSKLWNTWKCSKMVLWCLHLKFSHLFPKCLVSFELFRAPWYCAVVHLFTYLVLPRDISCMKCIHKLLVVTRGCPCWFRCGLAFVSLSWVCGSGYICWFFFCLITNINCIFSWFLTLSHLSLCLAICWEVLF